MAKPETIGESLYWSYANLAMMENVLKDGVSSPRPKHFAIRSRLYAGLRMGSMNVRGFFHDEKLKLRLPKACWYCGSRDHLSVDHIIPQAKGGRDGGENLVHSCRSCNSSKGSKDLLAWMEQRDQFPPLYLLRRYLKLAVEYCKHNGLMDTVLSEAKELRDELPFSLDHIPHRFPVANSLCMWVEPPLSEGGEHC